jgi:signal transduction histidine kinase
MRERSTVRIRSRRLYVGIISGCILVLAVCAWTVPPHYVLAHNILHHLNFIPLMLAGMLYGWRGAVLTMMLAGLIATPHLYFSSAVSRMDANDQLLELAVFGGAGTIAGLLAERERKQRISLEETKRELEQVYGELQQNIDRLKKAERLHAAGQLSASLAHEIRNPLAGISGAAGILKRGHASSDKMRDCLEIIDKESLRLNKLLTNFLVFARPRAPRFQPTDFRAVIQSVTSLAAHAQSFASVTTTLDVPDELPEVRCDPELMKQVLLNVLINATEATAAGGMVAVSVRCNGSRLLVSVRDEGCGIAAEKEEQIFDPFFTTKENGTGLGLSIASKILEQHGGALLAQRNSDRGMTFTIELPVGGSA